MTGRRWWQRPPLIAVASWLMVLLGFLYTDNLSLHGRFGTDPDNYMHAIQTRDWMTGAHDWFDTAEDRLEVSPGSTAGPDGAARLSDLPLAATALPFRAFLSIDRAILCAAVVLPLFVQLPLLFWLVAWAFRPLLGRRSWWATPLALLSPAVLSEFLPGRIDHHSWQLLLFLLVLGAALRLLQLPDARRDLIRNGLLCGAGTALSLDIGFEVFPWLLLILAGVGLAALLRPARLAPAAWAIAATLPAGVAALLLALRTPEQMLALRLDVLTLLTFKLTLAVGLMFAAAAWLGARCELKTRLAILASLATALVALLLADTPQLLDGPWLGFNPWLTAFTRAVAQEQTPLLRLPDYVPHAVEFAVLSAAGLAWAIGRARRTRAAMLPALALLAVLSAATLAVTLCYAMRVERLWALTALPGLVLLGSGLVGVAIEQLQRGPQAALRLLAGMVLLAAALAGYSKWSGWATAAGGPLAARQYYRACPLEPIAAALNRLPARQRVLLYEWIGPQLAWDTPHVFLGGSINNIATGLLARRDVFLSTEPAATAAALRRQQIDLVFICDLPEGATQALAVHNDVYNRPLRSDAPEAMIQRLHRGETFPWLQPLPIPGGADGMRLYRVVPEKLPASPSAASASTTAR